MVQFNNRRERIYFILTLVLLSIITYWLSNVVWNMLHNTNNTFVSSLMQWDAGWYKYTIENGYSLEPTNGAQANWAFFPLYPLIVKLFKILTGLSVYQSGFIVSNIFLTIALYIIFEYVSMTRSQSFAFSAVILFALGPYSFYFSSLYTESLFLCLLILCFYNLQRENWLYCGIFGALLSATRTTGVLFFIPLLLRMFLIYFKTSKNLFDIVVQVLKDEKKLLALLLVPTGLFAYMTFLHFHLGDALAFKHVQKAWWRTNGNPIFTLYDNLVFGNYRSKYLSLWGILGIIGSTYLLYKKRFEEGIFALVSIIIPMMSGVQSLPRYFIGTLVLIFAYNDIINQTKKYKWLIVITLVSFNILLLFLWFGGHVITI